jgi:hypothetical protein
MTKNTSNPDGGILYRICWSASSNITFHSATDWDEWDEPDMSAEDVEERLCAVTGAIPLGLEEALEASGFEWWVETKAADS